MHGTSFVSNRFLRRSSPSKFETVPLATPRNGLGKDSGKWDLRREDEKGRAKVDEIRLWRGGHLRAAAARFVERIKGRGRTWKSRGRPRRGGGLRHSTFVEAQRPFTVTSVHFFKSWNTLGDVYLKPVSRPRSDFIPPSILELYTARTRTNKFSPCSPQCFDVSGV